MPPLGGGPLDPSPSPYPSVVTSEEQGQVAKRLLESRGAFAENSTMTAIQTDLKLQKLQDQVETLTSLLHARVLPRSSSHTEDLERELEALKEENDRLRETLQDSESRLDRLQDGVVKLQEEYRSESEDLQERVEEMTALIEEDESEKVELKVDLEKTTKAKKGLENYIQTLPSEDEFTALKNRCRAKEDECGRLNMKITSLALKLEKSGKEVKGLLDSRDSSEIQLEELLLRLKEAEGRLSGYDRRRSLAKDMDGIKNEEVLARNDELKEENEQLRKLVHLTQKRHKREAEKKSKDMESMVAELEERRKEGDKMHEALGEQTTTSNFLRENLTECKAKVGALTRRSDALSSELDSARKGEQSWADLDGLYRSLAQEMSRCLREIKSLSETTKQIVGGEDPDVSVLLGLRDLSGNRNNGSHSSELPGVIGDSISHDGRLATLRSQLCDVKAVRTDLAKIRDGISEKYAENLGDNFNSCISQ